MRRISRSRCGGFGGQDRAEHAAAREPLACAALLYGYLLDLDGATSVAEAAAQFHFAVPPVSLDELPRQLPLLVVRAGRDAMPGLDATLQRFVTAARAREVPLALTLIDHAKAPHAFDLMDDTPMVDLLGLVATPKPVSFGPGFITVEVPPRGVLVLQPKPKDLGGYSRYKRVR